LTYAVCKHAGKDKKGMNVCNDEGSYDWSDSRTLPYRWFSNINACNDASYVIDNKHPADVDKKIGENDAFHSRLIPLTQVPLYVVSEAGRA